MKSEERLAVSGWARVSGALSTGIDSCSRPPVLHACPGLQALPGLAASWQQSGAMSDIICMSDIFIGHGSVLDGTPAIPVRGSVRLNSMTRIKRRRRLMGRESSQARVKPLLTIA